MYYASFGVLSLIIHIILNYDILRKKDKDIPPVEIRYKRFLYCVMLYYVSDILWGILYEWNIIPLVYADTVLYFVSMVLSVLLWTKVVVVYLGRNSVSDSILVSAGWLIFVYEIAILIFNFFKPVVFTFTDGIYEPGSARYTTLGLQIALFFATSVYTLVMVLKADEKMRMRYRAIGLSGLVMTVFTILQTLNPFLPYYAVGCLVAICIINNFVANNERIERERELGYAKHMAYTDSLTGVRNPHAYVEAKQLIDKRINDDEVENFGIVVFDLNGLKNTNDTFGHGAGDDYIKTACGMICNLFKHSPIYRIGGDEFVAVLEGDDYDNRIPLLDAFEKQMEYNQKEGGVVISSGLSDYIRQEDNDYNTVFERADRKMYERKNALKNMREK